MSDRTWTCSCGKVKVLLKGEPLVALNCHCKSCVSNAKYVDKKGGGRSALKDGGVNVAVFSTGQVEFVTGLSNDGTSNIQLTKIGDDGKVYRSYTKCCNTFMSNATTPKILGIPRTGIKNADCTTYDSSLKDPVLNIDAGNAFDPSSVPEPKLDGVPWWVLAKVLGTKLNPLGKSLDQKELFSDEAHKAAEIVPKTW